ncbi:MAG: CotH kinase family protein [Fibrobacterales bacterium]
MIQILFRNPTRMLFTIVLGLIIFLAACADTVQADTTADDESSSSGMSVEDSECSEAQSSSSLLNGGEELSATAPLQSSSNTVSSDGALSSSSTILFDSSDEVSSARLSSVDTQDISSDEETATERRDRMNTEIDHVFDQDELRVYNIIIDSTDLAAMDADPSAEIYYSGSLEVEGERYDNVAVRYKGNLGAWWTSYAEHCLSGLGIVAGEFIVEGHRTCQKLSLKIKFNTSSDPDRRFHELKKLQFHSMNGDRSQVRERLGYWLFRAMGVKAPRSVHAKVQINGEDNGLYALVEQIDGRFTRANFDNGKGNLYKEILPIDSDDQPHTAQEYLNALKTNEDENPSVALMEEFAEDIIAADENSIKEVIKQWMDIDEIIAHMMVNRLIWHYDGPWSPEGLKNYYFYEDLDRKKFTLIPWDMDHTLHEGEPWPGVDQTVIPRAGDPQPEYLNKLLKGFSLFETEYRQAVMTFRDDVYPSINENVVQWKSQLSPVTRELNATLGDIRPWLPKGVYGAPSESDWLLRYEQIESNIKRYSQQMIEYIGEP